MSEVMEAHPKAFAEPGDFLDLGCAPGGFASRLLEQWPGGRGYGVSMPAEKGGFPMLLHHDRWQVQFCNLMDLASPEQLECPGMVKLSLGDAQDLGRRVRSGGKGGRKGKAAPEPSGRGQTEAGVRAACAVLGIWALTLQEVLLGLSRLCEGGAFIFRFGWRGRLSSEEEWYQEATHRLFALLVAHFATVAHFKSEFSHQADTTFYLVAVGFKREAYEAAGLGDKLRSAIQEVLVAERAKDLPTVLDFLAEFATPEARARIEELLESVAKLKDIGQATRRHVEGRGTTSGRAGPDAALFISPVPFNLTMGRLQQLLEKFGKIVFLRRRAHPIGVGADAVVQFSQPSHATAALEAITSMRLLGDNIAASRCSDLPGMANETGKKK